MLRVSKPKPQVKHFTNTYASVSEDFFVQNIFANKVIVKLKKNTNNFFYLFSHNLMNKNILYHKCAH